LVSPVAKPGGAERALAGLARRLPALGFEPEAILLEEGPLENWLVAAGCSYRIVRAARLRRIPTVIGTVAAIQKAIRNRRLEIVISNHAKGHIYGGLAALAGGVPSVWWQHNLFGRSLIERVASSIPAYGVVVGCETAAGHWALRAPVVKIHPGIPVDEIARRKGSGAAVRRLLSWEQDPIVGIVGRLQPGKGQEVFLRAAALVADRRPDTRYLVVGGALLGCEGDYPLRLQRLAEQLGLAERVRFAGHQSDVFPWLDALDVVVHASFGEAFGLAVVEAMALGKPVVATFAGGPAEIIEDGVSGILVPPGQPQVIAEAVLQILTRREVASMLARNAHERARAFSEERMAAGFADLLSKTVSRRRIGADTG
jgi:glycosyltransferase involved in cell wall biosynthesis